MGSLVSNNLNRVVLREPNPQPLGMYILCRDPRDGKEAHNGRV